MQNNAIKFKNSNILFCILLTVLFTVDRILKLLMIQKPIPAQSELVFGLKLEPMINKGIAFGLPVAPFLLYAGYGLAFAFLIFWLIKFYETKKTVLIFAVSLIIIGATSNLLDRFRFGGVVDFLVLPRLLPFLSQSVINLADIYISAGLLLWIISSFPTSNNQQSVSETG